MSCELYRYVDKTEGLISEGISPSEIWSLTLNEQNDRKELFMKIFTSNSYKYLKNDLKNNDYFIKAVKGLRYEAKVYNDIIRYLPCTNFVKFYNYTKSCSYEQLENLVLKGHENDSNIHINKIKQKLAYLLSFVSGGVYKENPKISVTTNMNHRKAMKLSDADKKIAYDSKYEFMLMEMLPKSKTISLTKWMLDNLTLDNNNAAYLKHSVTAQGFAILFQCAAACYTLFTHKIIHNDLHSGNIMLVELPNVTRATYAIDGKYYSFYTKYHVKVIDFDRSYSEELGNNPNLKSNECKRNAQCNILFNNSDFLKVCYVFMLCGDKMSNENIIGVVLLSILSKGDPETFVALRDIYENNCSLSDVNKGIYFKLGASGAKKWYEGRLANMSEIIKAIGYIINSPVEMTDFENSKSWGVIDYKNKYKGGGNNNDKLRPPRLPEVGSIFNPSERFLEQYNIKPYRDWFEGAEKDNI
jgi:hypothetical protein